MLAEAVAAYRQALEVYTRETLPQQWAMTQNNLGIALRDQGIRTGGERGTQLLAEAVAAYRQALEVYTRETLPQDWAMTQNNLGIALRDQGIRTAASAAPSCSPKPSPPIARPWRYTRETLPQLGSPDNLGNALAAQGDSDGRERRRSSCSPRPSPPTARPWRSVRARRCRNSGP